MPKVTTLMSVYNAERYLSQAVESILSQTVEDFEFLIINDGSTDKSLSILKFYAKKDKRIHLVDQENIGLVRSLNKGLSLAQGKFLARMDADDIAMPNRFKRQIEYLEKHPECIALGSEVLQIDMDGAPICKMGALLTHDDIEAALLKGNGGALRHPALMARCQELIDVGGYQERFKTAEDLDLYLRLAERGKLLNLSDVLLQYRIHLGSVNFSKYEQQTKEVKTILDEAYARRRLIMPENILKRRKQSLDKLDYYRNWARMSIQAGYISTARKYAYRTLRQDFFSYQSWRMFAATIKRSQPWRSLLNSTKS